MKLSDRVSSISPSLTRQLFDLAQEYSDVIDLTLGDPDLKPAQYIRDAACKAIQEGKTRYSANSGLLEVRRIIAEFNSKRYQIPVQQEEVMLTVGGMEAIYLTLYSLINPGDEVIIPAPYWINYAQMVKLCGGVPIIIPTREENNFSVSEAELRNSVTNKTKLIILNTPNNPTGCIYSEENLRMIAKIVTEQDLYIISDEVYQSLIYDNRKHFSVFTIPGMKDRMIVVDSMSKHFSMTGWRLGYAIAPAELVSNMAKLQENIASCAPLPSQHAAFEAYTKAQENQDSTILNEFAKRREIILSGIKSIPGLTIHGIDATFYAFVNISEFKINSLTFAMELLKEQHVAVVPGRTYGEWYDNYIRIAFTLKEEKLKEAIERIRRFVNQIQGF